MTNESELHFPEDDFVDGVVLVVVSSSGLFKEVVVVVVVVAVVFVVVASVFWMIGTSSCAVGTIVVGRRSGSTWDGTVV